MSDEKFSVSELNRVRQVGKRGFYDRETVFKILDSCLVGNVGFVAEGQPFIIPMLFARDQDELLFHGSSKSRLMKVLTSGQRICVSVTTLDGLVMARSLFHHSMNYRAATAFGSGYEIKDEAKRLHALKVITDKVMPHRWDDARQPNDQETKATCVAAVKIDTASAKVRLGEPADDAKDMDFDVWSGVVPIRTIAGSPVESSDSTNKHPVPDYIEAWRTNHNAVNSHE
jgi:nitroimidazol reductase NimA-like FMN-containing flavoprotein (pyridoxamine 5'-phosphate oxidase superfamily)